MKLFLALTVLSVSAGNLLAQPRHNPPVVSKPVVVVRPHVNNYYVLPVYPRVTQNFGFSYNLVNPYYYNSYYMRPNFGFNYYYGYSFWK